MRHFDGRCGDRAAVFGNEFLPRPQAMSRECEMRIGMHRKSPLVLVLYLVTAAGCYQASKGSPEQKSESTNESVTVSVSVVKPKKENLQWSTQGPGYIQAFEQTPMFAKIAGYVEKWHVDIGDHVSKGKTLAELRIPELDVELKQKEALVAQAEAELKL